MPKISSGSRFFVPQNSSKTAHSIDENLIPILSKFNNKNIFNQEFSEKELEELQREAHFLTLEKIVNGLNQLCIQSSVKLNTIQSKIIFSKLEQLTQEFRKN